jgi:TRAP-type mannitol/chloroaromatic compound transport system substrate-binding protein
MIKNHLKLLFFFIVALFILGLIVLPGSSSAKEFKAKFFAILGPGTALHKTQSDWAAWVKKLSDGQLDISVSVAGAIVGAGQSIDALSKNILQMSVDTAEYWAGKNPTFAVMAYLPCGFENLEQVDFWMYKRGGVEMFKEAYSQFNAHFLAPAYYPMEYLVSKKPIRSLADFQGKKLVFSGSLPTALFTKLGASVVYMPTEERMPALERGVIDGGDIGTPNTNVAYGVHRVAKYLIKPSVHQPYAILALLINKDFWNSLPNNLKQLLEAASRDISWRCYREYMEMDAIALKKMKEAGVEIVTLPDSDIEKIREMALEVWNTEGRKTPLANKILDSQISLMKEIGLLK